MGRGDRTLGPAEPPAIQPFTGRIASLCQPEVDPWTQWTPPCGPSSQDRRLWVFVATCVPTCVRISFPFLCLELEDYLSNKLQHNSVFIVGFFVHILIFKD